MKNGLSIRNLSVRALSNTGMSHIVRELSFDVPFGGSLAIVGESGCGKTMTAMSIFGLLPKNCMATGAIHLGDENILGLREKELCLMRGRDLVLIPQGGSDFLHPALKVDYQMRETLKKNRIKNKLDFEKKEYELLKKVGFSDPLQVLGKYPFQLSGGMAQRVILANGLAAFPKLVLADEPTSGVDDETSELYLEQLTKSFKTSAVVIITHDISIARKCNKLLVMYRGRIMEYGDSETILSAPTHPYTKTLICALPQNGFQLDRIDFSKKGLKDGCPFYSRCLMSSERCREETPELFESNGVLRRCFNAIG